MEAVTTIEDVRTFETRAGNARFVVRDVDGNEYTTFREAIGNKARELAGKRVRIEYHEGQRGQYTNVYLDKVEPAPGSLAAFLHGLPHPLRYPVVVDRSGTFADGYRVQDSPYLELVSANGRILLQRDIAVKDWPSLRTLLTQARTK